MNIRFDFNLFGWHLGDFAIRIDVDQDSGVNRPVDGAVKGITRQWVKRMAR